jgi:hypothetical protein
MPSGSSPAAWAQPTVEVPTDHVAMVSHPDEVVNLITTAAQAVPAAT